MSEKTAEKDHVCAEGPCQVAFELIGLVPVNGEHPDDFELSEADRERLWVCSCGHCEAGDGICPMAVQALIGEYLAGRDEDLAHALAGRITPLADETSPPSEPRVEWGHRYHDDGSVIADSSETVARSRAVISQARGGTPLVLMRRTVTDWEEANV